MSVPSPGSVRGWPKRATVAGLAVFFCGVHARKVCRVAVAAKPDASAAVERQRGPALALASPPRSVTYDGPSPTVLFGIQNRGVERVEEAARGPSAPRPASSGSSSRWSSRSRWTTSEPSTWIDCGSSCESPEPSSNAVPRNAWPSSRTFDDPRGPARSPVADRRPRIIRREPRAGDVDAPGRHRDGVGPVALGAADIRRERDVVATELGEEGLAIRRRLATLVLPHSSAARTSCPAMPAT